MFRRQNLMSIDVRFNRLVNNFHSIEIVGRGRKAQLQVGENLNRLT